MRQKDAHTQMMYELEQLQNEMSNTWLDQSLPDDWVGLDGWEPVRRHRTRVTIRLDSDMVAWFRKLGPGYGPRMNRVLRIYWTSLMAGYVKGYPHDNTVPRIATAAQRMVDELSADRAARENRRG